MLPSSSSLLFGYTLPLCGDKMPCRYRIAERTCFVARAACKQGLKRWAQMLCSFPDSRQWFWNAGSASSLPLAPSGSHAFRPQHQDQFKQQLDRQGPACADVRGMIQHQTGRGTAGCLQIKYQYHHVPHPICKLQHQIRNVQTAPRCNIYSNKKCKSKCQQRG